ncbi:arginase family protein [Bacteroidales bacterium]|nr:arginase family protein [Bacteroidales bacterium]
MDINDFFDPVALNKPNESFYPEDYYLCKNIFIHTENNPIKNLENYDVVIFGVKEDRSAEFNGLDEAPDEIRQKLYLLRNISSDQKIIDLGNLKLGNTVQDTYYGIQEVIIELNNFPLNIVVLGGSNDMNIGVLKAYQKLNKKTKLVSIDSNIDISRNNKIVNSYSYLNDVIYDNPIYSFTGIGYQTYFTDPEKISDLKDRYFEPIRVGDAKANLWDIEPYLRDANIVSFDISAVRQCDAPGNNRPSPNGFYGDEACQLSKFAGLSNKNKVFGVYEVNSKKDFNGQTAHLAAQVIWHYLEGLSMQSDEDPMISLTNFKEFIITGQTVDLNYYKSMKTNRWWASVPTNNDGEEFIAVTKNDYDKAVNHDLPDRWLNLYRKLNGGN